MSVNRIDEVIMEELPQGILILAVEDEEYQRDELQEEGNDRFGDLDEVTFRTYSSGVAAINDVLENYSGFAVIGLLDQGMSQVTMRDPEVSQYVNTVARQRVSTEGGSFPSHRQAVFNEMKSRGGEFAAAQLLRNRNVVAVQYLSGNIPAIKANRLVSSALEAAIRTPETGLALLQTHGVKLLPGQRSPLVGYQGKTSEFDRDVTDAFNTIEGLFLPVAQAFYAGKDIGSSYEQAARSLSLAGYDISKLQ